MCVCVCVCVHVHIHIRVGTNREDDFLNNAAEREHPDCLAVVWLPRAHQAATMPLFLDPVEVESLCTDEGSWYGRANRLSGAHSHTWDIIDDVAKASWKQSKESDFIELSAVLEEKKAVKAVELVTNHMSAAQIIRQRRSAVDFDGKTAISASSFFKILDRVMPGSYLQQQQLRPIPWDVLSWHPFIHLVLFVHRVEGLNPGLYILPRALAAIPRLKEAMDPTFRWDAVQGCPLHLPLFQLSGGDLKSLAKQISCHQDIAGDR